MRVNTWLVRCGWMAVAGCSAAGPCHAAVTYISAARSVSATVSGTPQMFSSTALGEYNQVAAVTVNDPNPPFAQTASATASITSNLLPERIAYSLGAFVDDGVSASSGFGAGSASTQMSVRFTIDVPTPYRLLGASPEPFGFSAGASERLTLVDLGGGSGTDIFRQVLFIQVGGPPFANLSGILQPGTYDFTASVSASTVSTGSGTSSARSSFNRQLQIPAPSAAACVGVLAMCSALRRRRG